MITGVPVCLQFTFGKFRRGPGREGAEHQITVGAMQSPQLIAAQTGT